MENSINNTYRETNFHEILSRFLKYLSYGFLIAWIGILSSCTVGLHGRGYDDRDGYYQRQSDYYGKPYGNRLERRRYEREHRRWHRLHDNDNRFHNDRDYDQDDIEIGR